MKSIFITLAILSLAVAGCNHPQDNTADVHSEHEAESRAFTLFTDEVELFAEVTLEENETHVISHFTILDGYKPIREGMLQAVLSSDKGSLSLDFPAPSRDGIFEFSFEGVPSADAEILLVLIREEVRDTFLLGMHNCNGDHHAEDHQGEGGEGDGEHTEDDGHNHPAEGIVFLKEQAWKTDFAIQRVEPTGFRENIRTAGIMEIPPARTLIISARHSGIVVFEHKQLLPGVKLSPSEDIMLVSSEGLPHDNFDNNFRKAELDHLEAKKNFERAEKLYKENIIAEKELLRLQTISQKSLRDYELLKGHYEPGGHHIHLPYPAVLQKLYVSDGEFVEQGAPLLQVAGNQRMLLNVKVPLKYANKLYDSDVSADFSPAGSAQVFNSDALNGRLVSVGNKLADHAALIPVFIEVDNPGGFVSGSSADVWLKVGAAHSKIVVPTAALIENRGDYYAIVMIDGEHYEKREVTIGSSDGFNTVIVSGLHPDEYIVSQGAYRVYLASLSSNLPEHAHVH